MSIGLVKDRQMIFTGIDVPRRRAPEIKGGLSLPAGTTIVSADNHWALTEDIFYERVPTALKTRAPRILRDEDGLITWWMNGKAVLPPVARSVFAESETVPGCVEMGARLRDLDSEGIDKEIVFINTMGFLFGIPDLDVRTACCDVFNEHLAELQDQALGRFFGVGLMNFWDPSRARESVNRLKELGLKTFMIPQFPKGSREPISYAVPEMHPFWDALEEAGLPVCFHVGELFHEGPGGIGMTAMVNFAPFRKTFGELVFGGIFDRNPALRVIFVEGDINWVPGALQTADMVHQCYGHLLEPKIKHAPRHYWENNCYATFMTDPIGLRMLDEIGADRVMWTSDYPHLESVFGCGWSSIKQVLDATSPENASKIIGGTAMNLFGL